MLPPIGNWKPHFVRFWYVFRSLVTLRLLRTCPQSATRGRGSLAGRSERAGRLLPQPPLRRVLTAGKLDEPDPRGRGGPDLGTCGGTMPMPYFDESLGWGLAALTRTARRGASMARHGLFWRLQGYGLFRGKLLGQKQEERRGVAPALGGKERKLASRCCKRARRPRGGPNRPSGPSSCPAPR
jgi:hypothetical protein